MWNDRGLAIDPAKPDGSWAGAADDPALAEGARRLVEACRPEGSLAPRRPRP